MATNAAGIYVITHVDSGREYVGSAVNIGKRWSSHRCRLRNGKHHSKFLQRIYEKYGLESLRFDVLETVNDVNDLIKTEQKWIDERKPVLNSSPTDQP